MISTPPAALIPDAETAAPHPRQAELDGLIHAGVITHLVSVEESLDPLFAIAQMRDLPEVHFVAAFEDGLIALGCPERLPGDLQALAIPAVATAPPPETNPPEPMPEEALARIDRTAQQLEYLLDALRPDEAAAGETQLQPVIDRLEAIEHRINERATDPDLRSMKEQVTGLHRRFDGLDTSAERSAKLPDAEEKFAALNRRLGDIETGLRELAQKAAMPDQASALGAIGEALEDLRARQNTDPDDAGMSEVRGALQAMSMKLDQPPALQEGLADQLATLQDELSQLVKAPAPVPDLAAQEEKFDQFASVLAMTVSRIETSAGDIKASLADARSGSEPGAVEAKLDQLIEGFAASRPADLAPLAEQIDGLKEQLSTWPEALDQLLGDVKSLSEQPKTTLDLTEQRRTFATFSSTLSGVVQRLEAAVADISTKDRASEADLSETNALVRDVLQQLDALGSHQPDFGPARALLEEILSHAKSQPEALASLDARLEKLASRPAPAIDLTGQRADFARFGTALAHVVKRVEAALGDQAKDDRSEALQTAFEQISTRLDVLPDKETLAGLWSEDVMPLREAVAALTARPDPQVSMLDSLREDISALLKRPDPVMDLTAQRQGFARFGTALNTALTRLEEVTSALQADDSEQPNPAEEMIAVVQALPEILDSTVRQATNLEPVTTALTTVQQDIADLPGRIGLSDLNEAVISLTRRPDPVIDLTAQRQSFARFGTAITTVIERLDSIAQDLAAAGTEPSQVSALAETVARIEVQIRDETGAQTSKLESLTSQLAVLSDRVEALSDISADDQTTEIPAGIPLSLDELRLQFAELIAAQIKQNAASFQPDGPAP